MAIFEEKEPFTESLGVALTAASPSLNSELFITDSCVACCWSLIELYICLAGTEIACAPQSSLNLIELRELLPYH
jgi:hypothetical protein